MDAAVLSSLKHSLSDGFESLPKSTGKHRTFSYAGDEYLIRTLVADPQTIARITTISRKDHHVPEIITLADHTYEVQRLLPEPTISHAPLHTFDETRSAYERVWNAIGACHDSGVGHGDVHPENILYRDGEVKIIDWEWARARDEPSRLPRIDVAHFDYAGLAYTGRALFANHPSAAGVFHHDHRCGQSPQALERVVSRISEHLKLRPLS